MPLFRCRCAWIACHMAAAARIQHFRLSNTCISRLARFALSLSLTMRRHASVCEFLEADVRHSCFSNASSNVVHFASENETTGKEEIYITISCGNLSWNWNRNWIRIDTVHLRAIDTLVFASLAACFGFSVAIESGILCVLILLVKTLRTKKS